MKILTLNLTSALLAFACVANAESCANPTTSTNDSGKTARAAEIPRTPSKPLTCADFRMVKQQIDFNFQRLNSVSLPAMQCHMSVERVDQLFKHYAHLGAAQYLANLKKNSSAATLEQRAELASRKVASSWPDPYIIGR